MANALKPGEIVIYDRDMYGVILDTGLMVIPTYDMNCSSYFATIMAVPESAYTLPKFLYVDLAPGIQSLFDLALKMMQMPSPFPVQKGKVMRPAREL